MGRKWLTTYQWLTCLIVVYVMCVLRMNTLERTVWTLAFNSRGALISQVPTIAAARLPWLRLAVATLWPLYVAAFPQWTTHSWSEGLFLGYAVICADERRIALCSQMTKAFWGRYFKTRSILSPRVFASRVNGIFRIYEKPPDDGVIVLMKPDADHCGHNISLAAWRDLLQDPPSHDHVVQEYISYHKGQSFRVVTCKTPTGEAFVLQTYRVEDPHSITSNRGNVHPIPKSSMKLAPTLCACHTRDFSILPSIGWDIVMDEHGNEFVLEGNTPSAICWKRDCRAVLADFDLVIRQWLPNES